MFVHMVLFKITSKNVRTYVADCRIWAREAKRHPGFLGYHTLFRTNEKGQYASFYMWKAERFHSRFMKEAGKKLEAVLENLLFQKPKLSFISNVTASFEEDPVRIRENLVRQVSETVRFEASVRLLLKQGVARLVEIGPGKVLKGLVRKIDPQATVTNIETPEDLLNTNNQITNTK